MLTNSLTRRVPNISHLMDSFFDDSLFPAAASKEGEGRSWIPSVDLSQTEEAFLIRADLPGINRDDINLVVENNTLTLSGERKFENEENTENYNRVERVFGSFSRSFQLPSNVDPSGVAADFKDGVLRIELPKAEESKSRQIKIK